MKTILTLIVGLMLSTSAFAGNAAAEAVVKPGDKKVVYTTLDIKDEYEVVLLVSVFALLEPGFGDPLDGALKSVWKDMQKQAEKLGADAVVGIRFELENLEGNNAGRLMMYGTAVKKKQP